MNTYTHYTGKPFKLDRSREYKFKDETWRQTPHTKPPGLWLSDDSDYGWNDWANFWDFYPEERAVKYHVEADMENICLINSLSLFDKFAELYLRPSDWGTVLATDMKVINWPAVMRTYKGIVISPYFHERRLDFNNLWYYGWDCASGVIWDLTAIKSMERL